MSHVENVKEILKNRFDFEEATEFKDIKWTCELNGYLSAVKVELESRKREKPRMAKFHITTAVNRNAIKDCEEAIKLGEKA